MKKISTSVVALFLSLTAVNAQGNFAKNGADLNLVRQTQTVAPMLNVQKSPDGMQKIQLGENEKVLGFYDSDNLDTENTLGIPTLNATLSAGIEFTPDILNKFVGGKIKRVRFGLKESVGKSKVYIYPVVDRTPQAAVATVDVPTTAKGWNEVTIPNPVTIEAGKKYLIAFDYYQRASKFPLCVDGGLPDQPEPTEGGFMMYGPFGNNGEEGWYDMGRTYGNLCLQAVVEGGNFIDTDLSIKKMNTDPYMKAGGQSEISYLVKNEGNKVPSSYKIVIDVDGTTVGTFDTPEPLTEGSKWIKANITLPENLTVAQHTVTASITEINGQKPTENIYDDKISANTIVYKQSFPRQKNVVEQFTSTTCPNCPYADPVLDNIKKRGDIIHIAHHNNIPSGGDKMVCTDALSISEIFCESGNPSATFNRYLETDPELNPKGTLSLGLGYNASYAEAAAKMLCAVIDNSNKIPSFASINIKTNFDETSRVLKIEVYGEGADQFDFLMNNNAGLSVYLIEDGLRYGQAQPTGIMETVTHDNVMRKSVTNSLGDPIQWTGNSYKNTYELTLIKGWKEDNMHVVAFINRPFVSGESTRDGVFINNAEIVKVGTSTGINDAIVDNADVKEVARYTLDGRQITTPVKGVNIVKMSDGKTMKVLVK